MTFRDSRNRHDRGAVAVARVHALHGRIQPMIHPTPSPRSPRRATVKKSARGPRPETHTPTTPRPTTRTGKNSIAALRADAAHCRACPLYKNATQTVFGEGRATARIVFVGEQPGDREDLSGKPFVGPAGQLLDRALQQA